MQYTNLAICRVKIITIMFSIIYPIFISLSLVQCSNVISLPARTEGALTPMITSPPESTAIKRQINSLVGYINGIISQYLNYLLGIIKSS
jgi:hypothetical protein